MSNQLLMTHFLYVLLTTAKLVNFYRHVTDQYSVRHHIMIGIFLLG